MRSCFGEVWVSDFICGLSVGLLGMRLGGCGLGGCGLVGRLGGWDFVGDDEYLRKEGLGGRVGLLAGGRSFWEWASHVSGVSYITATGAWVEPTDTYL